ncbi:MAG: hypothetical protein ACFFG0_11595 [Candidatus Thorarchaeota archaeon]
MKFIVRKGTYGKRDAVPLRFEEFELECKGTGVEGNPIIIDSSTDVPNDFELKFMLWQLS